VPASRSSKPSLHPFAPAPAPPTTTTHASFANEPLRDSNRSRTGSGLPRVPGVRHEGPFHARGRAMVGRGYARVLTTTVGRGRQREREREEEHQRANGCLATASQELEPEPEGGSRCSGKGKWRVVACRPQTRHAPPPKVALSRMAGQRYAERCTRSVRNGVLASGP